MWRVMVIDDEVRQCKGLKNILLREFQGGYGGVGFYHGGRSACVRS